MWFQKAQEKPEAAMAKKKPAAAAQPRGGWCVAQVPPLGLRARARGERRRESL